MSWSLSWLPYWVLTAFALTVMATVNRADPHSTLEMDSCISKETCHECMQTPQCAWCSALGFTYPRCFSPNSFDSRTLAECPEEFVQNVYNSLSLIRNIQLTKDNSTTVDDHSYGKSYISSSFSSSSDRRFETVQFSPQELRLSLRLHEPYNISFSYAQAQDFPVDMYYFTNFRQPIENGDTNVIELADLLVESLRNVTSNFRWGFGSTISYSPSGGLTRIYGFKNMALSQNSTNFADFQHNFTVFDNLAAMDGGLNAILKATVCHEQIGWRSNSKKLLVFATDTEIPENITTLGEAMRRNDEQCNFSESGFSAYSSSQGHPTITEINRIVRENKINIIWAVTDEQYSTFERLTRHVEGSFVLRLNNSSIIIPELIQEQYNYISSSVEIRDTAIGGVKVTYFSSCLEDGMIRKTAKCDRLKVGTKVQFFAEIEATTCTIDRSKWHQQFIIYPVGINESLTVDLNMICDCDCENPSHYLYETQSIHCMHAGTLKCGICDCNDGHFGRTCECVSLPAISDHSCRPDNTLLVDCSGRGSCMCETCQCDARPNPKEMIYGRYCECDNFSCDRNNGLLCSNHGSCECGQCMCNHGWFGPACNCTNSNSTCIASGDPDGVLCSGHGQCSCGECICNTDENMRYSGRFCEGTAT